MKKIHTRIRIDMNTGRVVEDDFFWYDGPLSLCGEDDDEGMGPTGDEGSTYGADPAGLAGMFAGTDLASDFGEGFFEPGGGYEQNINTSAYMNSLAGLLGSRNWSFNRDPALRASVIDSLTNAARKGLTVDEAVQDMAQNGLLHNTVEMRQMTSALNKEYGGGNFLSTIMGGILGGLVPVPGGTRIGMEIGSHINPMTPTLSIPNVAGGDPANPTAGGTPGGGQDAGGGNAEPQGRPLTGTGSTGAGTGGQVSGTSYLDILGRIAQDMYNKTDPARQEIIDRGMNFLSGGLDVTESPLWGSGKNAAETQYRLARDATLANLPSGGALQSALATGETNKARTLTDLASQIGMDEYNKIYGLATGAPQQSISGLSAAAGTSASLAGQQMYQNVQKDAQKNQLYGDLGSGIGEAWGDK